LILESTKKQSAPFSSLISIEIEWLFGQ
jgi:hypothetical protein